MMKKPVGNWGYDMNVMKPYTPTNKSSNLNWNVIDKSL